MKMGDHLEADGPRCRGRAIITVITAMVKACSDQVLGVGLQAEVVAVLLGSGRWEVPERVKVLQFWAQSVGNKGGCTGESVTVGFI